MKIKLSIKYEKLVASFSRPVLLLTLSFYIPWANGFQRCSDINSGVLSNDLSLTTAAISSRISGNEKHIGNAIFAKDSESHLTFMTAHHVVVDVCEILKNNETADLVIEYHDDRSKVSKSNGFRLDTNRCNDVIEKKNEKTIDLDFFKVPIAAIEKDLLTTPHTFIAAPIMGDSSIKHIDAKYFGYDRFPSNNSNTISLNRLGNQNKDYSINKGFTDGWSGSPVFILPEVSKTNRYFLAGLIISSPDLEYIYDNSSDSVTSSPSDQRTKIISYEVAKRVDSNAKSFVATMSNYDFKDWPITNSRGVEMIENILNQKEDIGQDVVDKVSKDLLELTSLDQFELTAHLLKLIKSNDARLKSHRSLVLSIFKSYNNLCYVYPELDSALFQMLRDTLIAQPSYFIENKTVFIEMISDAQTQLDQVYRGRSTLDKNYIFDRSAKIFSMLYSDPASLTLNEEILKDGTLGKKQLSRYVFELGRIKALQGADPRIISELFSMSLEFDKDYTPAKWSLADHLNKNNLDAERASELYKSILESRVNFTFGDNNIQEIEKSREFLLWKKHTGHST